MFSIIEGTGSLGDLLRVVSAVCVIILILSEHKRIRVITGIIWIAPLIPEPTHLPYRIGGIVVFGGAACFIRYMVRKSEKQPKLTLRGFCPSHLKGSVMNTPNIESAQWVGYGFLRIPQERFNEAIAAFNQAIELEKDSLLAYQGGARCYTFLFDGNIAIKRR